MSLLFIVTLCSLSLYSTDWLRLKVVHYHCDKENYAMATDIEMKIIRKKTLSSHFDRNAIIRIFEKSDKPFYLFIEKELSIAQKEWYNSMTFFRAYRNLVNEMGVITSRFEKYRVILGPTLIESLNSWKLYNNYFKNIKYSIEAGYLDNDTNPETSPLINFGYSGGFALDCNLRSIGAKLGSKKQIVAIRLRTWGEKTRIKPENLSLWISDDNKLYQRYTGKITFSSEIHAITLDHLNFTCKYLKIHCNLENDKYTFAEDFKKIIETYGPPDFSQIQ